MIVSNILDKNKISSVLIEYDNLVNIYNAAKKVNKLGIKNWEIYSPFPIHGIEKIMNLSPSILPWIVFFFGLFGGFFGLFLTIWVSVYELPLNIGGKPLFSIPAFIPVIFELVILFSAISCVIGLFYLCDLPKYNFKLFDFSNFNRVTDDRFFIYIEICDLNNISFIEDLVKNTKALKIDYIES